MNCFTLNHGQIGGFILIVLIFFNINSSAQDKVILQLKWTHGFQFAGYYAAVEQGYYHDAGLEVSIQEAQPDSDPVHKVVEGEAQYGVGSSGLLVERAAGKPLVVLAAVFQHSPYAIYAAPEIGHLRDLIGKRLMLEPQSEELLVLLQKEGVSCDSILLIPHHFDTNSLINGETEAMSGNVSCEPYYFKLANYAYHTFSPRSEGIDFYGDNLYTSEQELAENPQRVKAFRVASLRGWQYAKEHPYEIINLIFTKYSQQHSLDYLHFEADQMIPLLQPDLIEIGYMNPNRWRHIADTYAGIGLLPDNYSLKGFIYQPDEKNIAFLYRSLGVTVLLIFLIGALAFYIYWINRRLNQSIVKIKQTNAALSESEHKYKDLINTSQNLIWTCDLEGKFTYLNPVWEESHGYKIEEMLGKSFSDFQQAEVFERDVIEFTRHLAGGSVKNYETSHLHKDGTEISLIFNAIPLTDSNANIIGTQGTAFNISKRVKNEKLFYEAKKRAENNEKRLKAIFNEAPTGIAVVDSDTGFIYEFNPMFAKIAGRSIYEMRDIDWMQITHPDDLQKDMDNMAMMNAGEINGFQIEKRYIHPDGAIVWINLTVAALIDSNTKSKQHLAMVEDISMRKQAEQELKNIFAETKKLETIINRSPAVAFLWRAEENWPVEYVSENIKQFGYTPEDFLSGKVLFSKIILPEDIERVFREVADYSQSGIGEFIQEYRIVTKLGDVKWINDHTWIRRDSNNTITHYQGIIGDITDRKQRDEQIRKLSRAVEQSPTTVIITDLNGDIEYVNPKFSETTGYSFDEAISKNPRILKSDEKLSEEYKELWETITSGKEWRGEFHNKKKNGELYWEFASISPIRNKKGIITHMLAVKEDITERKKAEDELKESEVRLRELNATKDKFFSIIAHDLKNPFNSIMGFSTILIDQVKEKDYGRIEEFAGYIHESSNRVMDLLQNLLEWASSQTGIMGFSPKYVDIVALINETSELLNDSARQKAITISWTIPDKADVFADKAMISTVLRNLISNAVKFTNLGGEIVISAEEKQSEILVSVKDKGIGIGKDDLGKLFRIEKTYSTTGTNNEKGTGLGLILCKDFIEKHKGEIWVESELGKGATFYFTVPLEKNV